jgi:hypothetical protein
MQNAPLEHLHTLETLVSRGVCTSVLVTAGGATAWVQANQIQTVQFPNGLVHLFGEIPVAEADIAVSLFDDKTGEITLGMVDGGVVTIQIVAQDVDTVLI